MSSSGITLSTKFIYKQLVLLPIFFEYQKHNFVNLLKSCIKYNIKRYFAIIHFRQSAEDEYTHKTMLNTLSTYRKQLSQITTSIYQQNLLLWKTCRSHSVTGEIL